MLMAARYNPFGLQLGVLLQGTVSTEDGVQPFLVVGQMLTAACTRGVKYLWWFSGWRYDDGGFVHRASTCLVDLFVSSPCASD